MLEEKRIEPKWLREVESTDPLVLKLKEHLLVAYGPLRNATLIDPGTEHPSIELECLVEACAKAREVIDRG